MSTSTRIQILIDQKSKVAAEEAFDKFGLNLSEGTRLLINSFVNGKAKIEFSNDIAERTVLSPEARKRFEKVDQDIANRKNITPLNPSKLLSEQI